MARIVKTDSSLPLLRMNTARNLLFIVTFLCGLGSQAEAQTAEPKLSYYSVDDASDVELNPGESGSAQAPLEFSGQANINDNGGRYRHISEWRVYRSDKGEDEPLLTRFDDDITYRLTASGGYGIKLYVTFISENQDTVQYESDPMTIVISESKLTCPDGFSPNGDGINDVYHITYQSIVKLSGIVFNRWGQKLHTFTLDNLAEGWDGMQNGKPVRDGVYFVNIDAVGSDGLHYKIKKAINVLKGFKETGDTTTE